MKREQEVAMISAIMSDIIADKLYKKLDIGYIATMETISSWAIEFFNRNKKTEWDEVLGSNYLSLSFEYSNYSSIDCWDEAVMDYAYHKLEML